MDKDALCKNSEGKAIRPIHTNRITNAAEKLATYGQFALPKQDIVIEVSTDYYVVNVNNTIDPKGAILPYKRV